MTLQNHLNIIIQNPCLVEHVRLSACRKVKDLVPKYFLVKKPKFVWRKFSQRPYVQSKKEEVVICFMTILAVSISINNFEVLKSWNTWRAKRGEIERRYEGVINLNKVRKRRRREERERTILAKQFILERPEEIFQLVWTCNLIDNPL